MSSGTIEFLPLKLHLGLWTEKPIVRPGGFVFVGVISERGQYNPPPSGLKGRATEVYVQGVLERLEPHLMATFLSDTHDLLKPSGRVDFLVPDFEAQCKSFMAAESGAQKAAIMHRIFGYALPYTRIGLWESELRLALETANFDRIERLSVPELHMMAFKKDEEDKA